LDNLLSPEQQQAALSLLLALAIGLLFGLERGWHREQADFVSRPAGVRTFGLLGLLGGTAGLLATLKLLLISVVMLPILPNQGYGPAQALNPYELW
jgi:uncharacterized membrane protein YhiD involved in acid resistance